VKVSRPGHASLLVLSGEGPYFKNGRYFDGSLLALDRSEVLLRDAPGDALADLTLHDLVIFDGAGGHPLLRPKRGAIPNLTSFTLDSILAQCGREYEMFDLHHVWERDQEPLAEPGVVFLSTTFICARRTLMRAIGWIEERYPAATLVLGGQYSNLKYDAIMREFPSVDYVVRGDGEVAIPLLLDALDQELAASAVVNLVHRDAAGRVTVNDIGYIDLDGYPSPSFGARAYPIVPYESMRGCPYRCKFCSFPFASPEWRYKSAAKIADDWRRYADDNGATHIRAMDSTFTVPPSRMHALFDLLPDVPVTWEAYTRANALRSAETIAALEATGCSKLSIGFESMSPNTLDYMFKKVTAEHNRVAHDLLRTSAIHARMSFMVGYPGETPEDYELTHRYLCDEFSGHFMLSVFSMTDETMPVWQDAQRFEIVVDDLDNPDDGWRHVGMDLTTASELHARTLDEVRRNSEDAVLLLWQTDYHTPLVPGMDRRTNLRLEKVVERLGMLPVDVPDGRERLDAARGLLAELGTHGIGVRHQVAATI